jgi:hypothetical protein
MCSHHLGLSFAFSSMPRGLNPGGDSKPAVDKPIASMMLFSFCVGYLRKEVCAAPAKEVVQYQGDAHRSKQQAAK